MPVYTYFLIYDALKYCLALLEQNYKFPSLLLETQHTETHAYIQPIPCRFHTLPPETVSDKAINVMTEQFMLFS